MPRQRSITIYAEDENEFSKEYEKETNFNKAKTFKFEDSDDEDNYLGINSGYQIEKRDLTLKEKEEEEEIALNNLIEDMNFKYKYGLLKNENLYEESESDSSEEELYLCPRKKRKNEISSIKTLASSNFSDEDSYKNILNHNLINYNKVIKIMIIGQKKSGKTLFLNKLLNIENKNNINEIFEIKSKVIKINEDNIKLEIWDCKEEFLNSPLINVYYKIANGFIIIVDNNSNLDFIKNQIKSIQSIKSSPKFLFLYNYKNNEDVNQCKERFEQYCKNNYLKLNTLNLYNISLYNQIINDYLETLI